MRRFVVHCHTAVSAADEGTGGADLKDLQEKNQKIVYQQVSGRRATCLAMSCITHTPSSMTRYLEIDMRETGQILKKRMSS